MKQADRAIDWQRDDTRTILRKIRGADGTPGVRDTLYDRTVYLFDAQTANGTTGIPGTILAKSGPALCRATTDGAVWIGHLHDKKSDHPFKLPTTMLLAPHISHLKEIPVDSANGYTEIQYEEQGDVGFLHFDFYNGAMGTNQCARLLSAYNKACARPTKVIVLTGGRDFWSNGMHLNLIEAAESAADESWGNINAIDDLAEAIIRTRSHLTVAALRGNAGAGGVFLARAADHVWLREGVVLNPHYKDMGNLYGSEFWTFLLPRYAGQANADIIAAARLPMGAREAVALGLADARFGEDRINFLETVRAEARRLAEAEDYDVRLTAKNDKRDNDEAEKPLSAYRQAELERMHLNFYGFDPSYHVARYNFVYAIPKSRTPITIARHRDRRRISTRRKAS